MGERIKNELEALAVVVQAATQSPCAKSKRGVVVWTDGYGSDRHAVGFNGPPAGFACDGSDECRAGCSRLCMHAEARALAKASRESTDLLHVKVVNGVAVPSGPPSGRSVSPCRVDCARLLGVAVKKRTLPREILTDAEVAAVLEQCGETLAGIRNRALIRLLDGTGVRISEALDLEPRDIEWTQRLLNVRRGKGGRQRVVPIGRGALGAIEDWLRARSYVGIADDAPVCCNLKGGRMSSSYIRKRLPVLAVRAGIVKRTHPHGFRHRFTTRLIRRKVVITSVSQILGHTNLATTHNYCTRLGAGPAIDDVRTALRELDRGRGVAR